MDVVVKALQLAFRIFRECSESDPPNQRAALDVAAHIAALADGAEEAEHNFRWLVLVAHVRLAEEQLRTAKRPRWWTPALCKERADALLEIAEVLVRTGQTVKVWRDGVLDGAQGPRPEPQDCAPTEWAF